MKKIVNIISVTLMIVLGIQMNSSHDIVNLLTAMGWGICLVIAVATCPKAVVDFMNSIINP